MIDGLVLKSRYPAAQPLAALQPRQPLRRGQRVAVQRGHTIQRGLHRIKGSRDRLAIDNSASIHTLKLNQATDKKPCLETAETTVTQVISDQVAHPAGAIDHQ